MGQKRCFEFNTDLIVKNQPRNFGDRCQHVDIFDKKLSIKGWLLLINKTPFDLAPTGAGYGLTVLQTVV